MPRLSGRPKKIYNLPLQRGFVPQIESRSFNLALYRSAPILPTFQALTAFHAGITTPIALNPQQWPQLSSFVTTLLASSTDGVFIKESSGQYLYLNQAGNELLHLMGTGHSDLLDAEFKALRDCEVTASEKQVDDGTTSVRLQFNLVPLFDAEMGTWGVLGFIRTVSEDAQLEGSGGTETSNEDSVRLRRLYDASLLGVMVVEPAGAIFETNQMARHMLGRSREEIEGGSRLWADFVRPEYRAAHERAVYQLLETGVALPWETEFLRPDGWRIPVLAGAVILDSKRRCLVYLIDIEERRRTEVQRETRLENEQSARAQAEATIEHLQGILAITDTALTHLDSAYLLDELVERICALSHADAATLWLLEDEGNHLRMCAAYGIGAQSQLRQRLRIGESLIGEVAARRETISDEEVRHCETGNLFLPEQLRSGVGVPLIVGTRVIGVLHVSKLVATPFSADVVHLLQMVADRAAIAIERSQLFEQVRVGREQLDSVSRHLLSVQENERRHVARELHDEIGQVLTAVKISLQRASKTSAPPGTSSGEVERTALAPLEESVVAVEAAIAAVRDLSLNLRPPMLDELGLMAALHWFANRQAKNGAFECILDATPPAQRPPAEIEIACFRVAQEAVTNAARHARASRVTIRMRPRSQRLDLRISDDGIGFDTNAHRAHAVRGESLGLLNMEERVRLANGTFSLKSKIGGGTVVRASFPLVAGATIPSAQTDVWEDEDEAL